MEYKGLTLDTFQEDSIHAMERNESVVVSAPTGSGKTLVADYIINKFYGQKKRIIYTAPIKALSNQKYKDFCADYGAEHIGLVTGDIVKNPEAPVVIMTTEIYRNMALIRDPSINNVQYVIFDEIHYINDRERGYVWEESVIFSSKNVRFVCLSATIPNAQEFANWIEDIKGHDVTVVHHDKRYVPLERKFFDTELGVCTLKEINEIADIPSYEHFRRRKKQRRPKIKPPNHLDLVNEVKTKTPLFFFCFSRQRCQENALELARKKWFDTPPEVTSFVRRKLADAPPELLELPSTKLLRYTLSQGVGFHHAGLLPILKDIVEELFAQGKISVLYTTETFAVGINMPAKTVCFENLRKYDGISFRYLNSKEYFQIAGRAGRRGIDTKGYAYAMIQRRDFDYPTIKKFTTKDVEPIHSQFKISVNTVLNMVKLHTKDEIAVILKQSFYTYQQRKKQKKSISMDKVFERTKKKLEKFGYIHGDELTPKGEFGSHIYSDEIITSEIFATDLGHELNEYQMLMVVAAISFEPRERMVFSKTFPSKFLNELIKKLSPHNLIIKDKRFGYLKELTSLIHPIYHNGTLFDVLGNVSMLEGDIVRFYRQMIDRLGQIKQATSDARMVEMVSSCQRVVADALVDVDSI